MNTIDTIPLADGPDSIGTAGRAPPLPARDRLAR
jgi:hypothetical protein